MKKILSVMLTAAMLLSLVIVAAVPASAVDGDWTIYASPEETVEGYEGEITSVPGYEYTADGFHLIPGDWTGDTPWAAMRTKDPVNLQDGIYMEVRVDNFTYEASDKWIDLNIWDSPNMVPGSPNYGKGVQVLIRPEYDAEKGKYYVETLQWFMEGFTRRNSGDEQAPSRIYVDDNGSLTVTLELKNDGSLYSLFINGGEAPLDVTMWINNYFNTNMKHEGYVGVAMQNSQKDGTVECTITKFGTSKETAIAPSGDDKLSPVKGTVEVAAPIADAATIPEGEPCFLLTGDKINSATKEVDAGVGDSCYINDDFSVRVVTVNDMFTRMTFSVKSEISYDIDDFPIMLCLTKNFCTCEEMEDCIAVETVTSYLMTGDTIAAGQNCKTPELSLCEDPIVIEEGDKAGQYLYFYYDSGEDIIFEATGRINGVFLDFNNIQSQIAGRNGVDVEFVAFFRNIDDAENYVMNYLGLDTSEGDTEDIGGEDTTEAGGADVDEPTTEAGGADVDEPTTEAGGADVEDTTKNDDKENTTEKNGEEKTEAQTDAPKKKDGCGSFIGTGAFAVIAFAAVCGVVSFKKKEN